MSNGQLYSIGYGSSRSVEDIIDLLRDHDIHVLVDVRSRPFSRYRPAFSKDALAQSMRDAGIRYLFMGDQLGGMPDDPTCQTDGKPDYRLIATRDWFLEGLDRLREGMQRGYRMALMCAEVDPERCHRTRLVGEALKQRDIELSHIDRSGAIISQTDAMARLHRGQGMLFSQRDQYE